MRVSARWIVVAVLWAAVAAAAEPQGPAEVVERLHGTLLEVMKDAHELGYEGRYAKLDPVVRQAFDLRDIVRIAVGSHWGKLSEEDRELLVDTFSRLSVATYASRFDGYSGETFTLDGVEDLKRGRKLVRSGLVKPSGEKIRFDYVLQPEGDGWKIVNVVVDGVSDLSLKRAQYTATLEAKGFAGLLDELKDKIRGYENSGG